MLNSPNSDFRFKSASTWNRDIGRIASYRTQGKSGSTYGPISVISQLLFDITLHEKVAPFEFVPQPKVFSRVIEFKKRKSTILDLQFLDEFKKFLKIMFSHPRKKIKHQGVPDYLKEFFNEDIFNKRSQELSPEVLYNLFLSTISKV